MTDSAVLLIILPILVGSALAVITYIIFWYRQQQKIDEIRRHLDEVMRLNREWLEVLNPDLYKDKNWAESEEEGK